MNTVRIEISTQTVLKTTFLVVLLWLLFILRDIVVIIFLAFIFMSAFSPLVDYLEAKKVPRWIPASLITLSLSGLVFFSLASLIPPFVEQTKQLILGLPIFIERLLSLSPLLQEYFAIDADNLLQWAQALTSQFSRELVATPVGVVRLGASFVQRLFTLVTLLFITFYLLVEHRKVKKGILAFLPSKKQKEHHRLLITIESQLGAWLRGEFLLMFIIGLGTYVALTVISLPFALPLAVLAGILEIVPVIGPIISLIPAMIVAGSLSPVLVLAVVVIYTVIQQLESNFLVPTIMRRAVGLDPLVVIVALMVGTRLMGPTGALLSVPTVVVLMILLGELSAKSSAPNEG